MDYLNYGKSKSQPQSPAPQSPAENRIEQQKDFPRLKKQSQVLLLFPTTVCISTPYADDYSSELEWVKTLEMRGNGYCDTVLCQNNRSSKNTNVLENPIMANIRSFIEVQLSSFASEIMRYKEEFVITQSWINMNGANEQHHPHAHANSILSGVFYLQVDRESPPIAFSNPYEKNIQLEPIDYNSYNGETHMLNVSDGELILFPSHFRHSVPPNNGDRERISLSFNTWVRGALGSIESLTYLPKID